jgi:acetyl-CoA carboxylase biotin carboxylase subunit
MVTGVDLIKEQIRIASGEKLSRTQEQVPCIGAAIECRINAENPEKNFQPNPGKITGFFAPGGLGVRFDSHVYTGYTVPAYYDSMIGKLIVHRPTRGEAIETMRRALRELQIEGICTTAAFHERMLTHPEFIAGRCDTTFVDRELVKA